MTEKRMEMHDSLKKLISEIFGLADSLSAEIIIGVRLNLCSQKTWAINGTTMKDEFIAHGLRFNHNDVFYNEMEMKDEFMVHGLRFDDNDVFHNETEMKDVKVAAMIRQTLKGGKLPAGS
jgi:hypothetical protein